MHFLSEKGKPKQTTFVPLDQYLAHRSVNDYATDNLPAPSLGLYPTTVFVEVVCWVSAPFDP